MKKVLSFTCSPESWRLPGARITNWNLEFQYLLYYQGSGIGHVTNNYLRPISLQTSFQGAVVSLKID